MPYKCLSFLIMLYFTVMIITVVMIYKIVQVGTISLSASSIIIPFWYVIGDILAEVYGVKLSRKLITYSIVCEFVFIFVCYILTVMPSPDISISSNPYASIFLKLPRVFLGSAIALAVGMYINSYAITRWKALVKGKYFWFRSIASTLLGEAFFVFIAFMIEFLGRVPFSELLGLMLVSYVIKIAFAPILSLPASYICAYLKKKEGVDVYDNEKKFTPYNFFN